MKVKIDSYSLGVVINSLYNYRHCCEDEAGFSDFLLRLVNQYEGLKPGRKKKIVFQPDEIKLIRTCLMAWRNDEIQAEKKTRVEAISETFTKFL